MLAASWIGGRTEAPPRRPVLLAPGPAGDVLETVPTVLDLLALSLAAAAATTSPDASATQGFEGFAEPDPAREPVPAPGPSDEGEGTGPRTWIAGAFVDTSYLFNSNFPANHLYAGAVTHPRTGELTLNVVAAQLRHEASDDEPVRFEQRLQVVLLDDEPRPDEVHQLALGDDAIVPFGERKQHVERAPAEPGRHAVGQQHALARPQLVAAEAPGRGR